MLILLFKFNLQDIQAILPTLLILLVGLLIMVLVIPYAFSSVFKQLEMEKQIERHSIQYSRLRYNTVLQAAGGDEPEQKSTGGPHRPSSLSVNHHTHPSSIHTLLQYSLSVLKVFSRRKKMLKIKNTNFFYKKTSLIVSVRSQGRIVFSIRF